MTGHSLLTPKAAEHLAKLCGMFGSHHDGERAAAARLADEFVRRLGLTWPDVIFIAPEWTAMAEACRERAHLLTERECEFVANIARLRRMPSDKQLNWLITIYERLQEEGL
ncbi:MAG: hypothetical protein WBW73_31995 [Rhodoplanes sp.]